MDQNRFFYEGWSIKVTYYFHLSENNRLFHVFSQEMLPGSKSFDLFGDGSVVLVNIPGHSAGLCAVKVKNAERKFVLLFSDESYARKFHRISLIYRTSI